MKIQSLSTLTHKQAWTIFFLTLLHLKESKAGNAFRNCLTDNVPSGSVIYDNTVKYALNKNFSTWNYFCCDVNGCLPDTSHCDISKISFGCVVPLDNQIPACYSPDYRSTLPKNKCAGIIGDVADIRSGDSPFLNYLKTLTPIGMDKGYALYHLANCPNSANCGTLQYCSWDNNVIACYGETSANIVLMNQLVFNWPGPADKHPSTYTYNPTQSVPAPTSNVTPAPSTDNHLAEKIAISVGTVTGISLTSFLTYYFCRKKRRQRKLLVNNPNNQRSVDMNYQQQSEMANDIGQSENNNLKVETVELAERASPIISESTSMALRSPFPSQTLSIKEQLIKQLKLELVGKEQLWSDYLDAKNWLVNNPNSQLASREFTQIQDELLKIFTISDLALLLENETSQQARSPQGEYFEIKEEARNPQGINDLTPVTENNYRNPQSEYFEVAEQQGII